VTFYCVTNAIGDNRTQQFDNGTDEANASTFCEIIVIMKAAVFAFFVLALCAVAIQASPLEDTLGAFMRGGYQAQSQAPKPSCCKLSCQYTQICEQVIQRKWTP